MPENLVMTSAYARTTVRPDSGSRGKKLSRVGKWVPDMYVAFRFGAKWTIFNRGNKRIWSSKNLDWSFLCPTHDNIFANKFLNLLRRAKSTPCLISQNFDRLIRDSKLVQHLEICLLTDLPTTGAYFSFQLSCSCPDPTVTKWNTNAVEFLFLFLGFRRGKFSMAAFVIVHAGSYGGLQEKSF